MRKQLEYSVHTLIPYINWVYFDHAWGVSGKTGDEKKSLREDAMLLLEKMNTNSRVQCIFRLCEANSEGDDIIVDGVRIPMLRQQQTTPSLCLADFIRPKSMGIADRIGLFATTCHNLAQEPCVEGCAKCDDPYQKMLLQTLSDRLAEAAAEVLHLEVRKHYWGYAPDENLTIEDLHAERFQGIRPAVGYPSLPDTSINFLLSDLLDMKSIGIRLTESGMMVPHASVSGLMIAHPEARYFDIGKIGTDQLSDYARRRAIPQELMRRFLK
jgi:cobalamin-dependent methionine synthase I